MGQNILSPCFLSRFGHAAIIFTTFAGTTAEQIQFNCILLEWNVSGGISPSLYVAEALSKVKTTEITAD